MELHYTYRLSTKVARSRCLDIGQILSFFFLFFLACLWTDAESKPTSSQKREQGQFPAIMAERASPIGFSDSAFPPIFSTLFCLEIPSPLTFQRPQKPFKNRYRIEAQMIVMSLSVNVYCFAFLCPRINERKRLFIPIFKRRHVNTPSETG